MISLNDLKRKFAVFPVEGLGDCVVIPGEQLDLDWVLMFLEEGYRFEGLRLDGQPAVLVQIKPMGNDVPERNLGVNKKEVCINV